MAARLSPQLWSDGQCPFEGSGESLILKWFNLAYNEARSFLDSQPGVEDISQALSIVRGKFWCQEGYAIAARSGLSSVYFNRANVQSEKLCFTLTNLAPGFELKEHSDDPIQIQIAKSLDKQVHEWLESPKSKSSIRKWLLNHRLGVSYISPVMVDPLLCESPSSGIECKTYNYDQVLFYQMGEDLDHQKAEAVIIENHVPLERVRKVYNKLDLPMDAESKDFDFGNGLLGRGVRRIRNLWEARSVQFGLGKLRPQKMKTVFHVYINDKTVNTSGQTMRMGQILNENFNYNEPESDSNQEWLDTHWTYDVPSYKTIDGHINTVPSGAKNLDGSDIMRLVEKEECLLYPTRRLLVIIGQIGSQQILWYDGPSYWAHGLVPIVPMRAQDNGIDHMAGSMFRDIIALNAEYNKILRGILNKIARVQNPNLLVNEKFGPDKAKQLAAGYPGSYFMWNNYTGMEACRPAWPDEFYKVFPEEMAALEKFERLIDFTLGINDPQSMMESAKLQESDSIEDLYKTKGEVMEDRGRRMEHGWLVLGYMITMLMAQFDSLPRRLAAEGEEGLSPADLDKDPSNMIPSHLPGENTGIPSSFSRMMRTRYYMRQMSFKVDANTAYGFSNSEKKLEMELLRTRGFPIPFNQEARVFRFQNFGEFPGATWLEQYAAQTKWQAQTQGVAVSLGQVAGQLVQAAAGLQALAGSLGMGGGQAGGGNPSDQATATHHGQTGEPTGRPNSYQQMPEQETKDGGARQTVTTS